MSEIIEKNNIKFLLDIHGLGANRACDVNLGTHLGDNIEVDPSLLCALSNKLNGEFDICIDQPFMANSNTISSYAKKHFPTLWSLQIEINCAITNKKENFDKFEKLLITLLEWMKGFTKEKDEKQKQISNVLETNN